MKHSITLFIVLVFLVNCNGQKAPTEMTALEVMGQIKNDFAILIDVRERSQIKDKAQMAMWIPVNRLKKESIMLEKLDRSKTLVFYGSNKEEALKACEEVKDLGFQTAYIKSYDEWKKENLPIQVIK